jgi:hypothetical protein
MGETADGKNRRKRKSRIPAGDHLVVDELLRRGFDAKLAREHVVIVQRRDSPPKTIQVKAVHSTPWYVRRASFARGPADKVTVYVLLSTNSARFFVVRNCDLLTRVCEPQRGKAFDIVDAKTMEEYENKWDILV